MSAEKQYHRTFESNRVPMIDPNWQERIRRTQTIEPYRPPYQGPTMGPPSSGRGSTPPRRGSTDAYFLNRDSLEPIMIWERDDQKPILAATPWERWWSKLFRPSHQNFIPIVNENNVLIGHYGRVHGHQILIQEQDKLNPNLSSINQPELAQAEIHMLVGNGDVEKEQGYVAAYNEYSYYSVQTNIDGEVSWIKFEGFTSNGSALPVDFSPADLLAGAKLIIRLGYAIAVRVGAQQLLTITGRVIAKRASRKAAQSATKTITLGRGYDQAMGIPPEHLTKMIEAAKETGVIAIFRANKKASIDLIRNGAHGKPMWAKFKTSADTGVLTTRNTEERAIAMANEAFVVDADLVAKRMARRVVKVNGKEVIQEVKLNGAWKVEAGQVVGKDGKPYVGDYDLLGVAPMKSPGSNVSLVPDDIINGDWNGPWVKKYAEALNKRLDKPRVLHGAQDAYGGKVEYRGLTDDTAYAVFPDGSTLVMQGRIEQQAFYDHIGRQAKSKLPAPVGDPNFKMHVVK